MAVSSRARRALKTACADSTAGNEVADKLIQVKAAAIAALTITPTSGTLPTPNGAVTVADTTTPTVVELLELVVELNAKFNLLRLACQAAGVTL
jgi:hypothetical protein